MSESALRRNPSRRCRLRAAYGTYSARPTSSSSSSPTSGNEYHTPPVTAASSDDAGSPVPPAAQSSARRGRPLPASLRSTEHTATSMASATGGSVRRMRWSQGLNENVMRAYYGATEGGTNLTAYRSRMFALFQDLNPGTTVTVQRLSDQVRAIQRLQLLAQPVLDRLRLETLSTRPVVRPQPDPAVSAIAVQPVSPLFVPAELVQNEEVNVNNQYDEQLRRALDDAILVYRDVPASDRPRLPRLPMNKHILALTSVLNTFLQSHFDKSENLTETHSILYCGAVAVCRVGGVRFPNQNRLTTQMETIPAWQHRIELRINTARIIIAKLYAYKNGNSRPRVMRFVHQAFNGTGVRPQDYNAWITERIDFYKQKVQAWAKRIRRFKERSDRYKQNRLFQSDAKKVYRNWEQNSRQISLGVTPDPVRMYTFWQDIWAQPINHTEGEWMTIVRRSCEHITAMEQVIISQADIARALRLAPNWKSPGPDGLHNFWLKRFHSSHERLATQFQNAISSKTLPTFLTNGVTYLLYKSGSTSEPKNYRPITCLPTTYKLLTSIFKFKIMDHILANNIMATAQNGCKPRSRGTKELLLIDMTICQQVRRVKKNISMAWIDYKKAYDSVPHSWLSRVLDLYRLHPNLCSFLGVCMSQWTTRLCLPDMAGFSDSTDLLRIKRGIFQGDSLSPLWFCLAMNPLSTLLMDSKIGYRLRRDGEVISHLLYMDDLKLYAPKKSDLVSLLKITENFSNDIKMEFGVDKCAAIHVQRGRVVTSEELQLSENMSFRCLSESETYRYLGMAEGLGIADKEIKQSLTACFFSRLTKVLKSLLSGGNKVRAVNGWVMPALAYSFGILRWTQTELDALDRKVRRQLTLYRMHHPRSSVMRLYIPRKCGGRGFLNAKNLHNREVCNLREYFLQSTEVVHRDMANVDNSFTPLSLAKQNWRKPQVLSISDRTTIWKSKELHGRFYKALTGPDVDQLASVAWLRFSNLFGETEGFACAIMDEVIMTNNYRRHILKDGTADICRACHRPGESIRHIVSGCSRLANGEYLHRHNQVAKIVHQQLALKYSLVDTEVPYYQYQPAPVLDNGHVTLYWDRSIITDRTIPANKPDIVIIDRSASRAMLVDVTIPHDENLVKAEKEKLTKYLDLAHEVTAMWHVDSTIIVPIVVSVNGLIAKSFDQHLKKLSLGCWIKGLIQKAVILDSARIVRRFLSLEP